MMRSFKSLTVLFLCMGLLNFAVADAQTFRLRGRAFGKPVKLKPTYARKSRFVVQKRIRKVPIVVALSSDYPDLVEFRHETINFKPNQRRCRTFVTLASFEDFVTVFPELASGSLVVIPVRAIDVDSGDEDNSMSITVRAP